MQDKRYQWTLFLLFAIVIVGSYLLFPTEKDIDASIDNLPLTVFKDATEWRFPTLYITSAQHPFHVEPHAYNDEIPFWHAQRITWHDGFVTLSGEIENAGVQLRGRGNSSWWGAPEKRPLRIRFHEPQVLIESGYAHRDWILLANAFDHSMLRNYFVLRLANLMGNTGFVPSSRFVHLYINGSYVGVYQLTDERDVGEGRLELLPHPNPAISEYLLELDRRSDSIEVYYRNYRIRFPSENNQTQQHVEYVKDYLYAVSNAIRARDWLAITMLIDVPSFVDFYIIQEFTKDVDVAFSSKFMQIRSTDSERRLYLGPVWDFDLSLGLIFHEHHEAGIDNSPEGIWAAKANYWFENLIEIPEFREAVVGRWKEVTEHYIPLSMEDALYMANTHQEDFERNFSIHSIAVLYSLRLGEAKQFETYMEHVVFLIDFIVDRANWLDEYFTTLN